MMNFCLLFYKLNTKGLDRKKFQEEINALEKLNNVKDLKKTAEFERRKKVLKKYFKEQYVDMVGITRQDIDEKVFMLTNNEFHKILANEFRKLHAIPVASCVKLLYTDSHPVLEDLKQLFKVFDLEMFTVRVLPHEDLKVIIDKEVAYLKKDIFRFRQKPFKRKLRFFDQKLNEKKEYLGNILKYYNDIIYCDSSFFSAKGYWEL